MAGKKPTGPVGDATAIAHTGRPTGDGPVNPPIERASTLLFARAADLYGVGGRYYGRMGMGVHDALGEALSALQGAARTLITSSGLSACTAPLRAFARPGRHVLLTDSIYGPTRDFAANVLSGWGVAVEFYDPRIGAGIADLIREETALIALESPGSLTFEVQDVPAICAAARARGVLTMIDDTWSAGLLSKPLSLGVDMACQALTKYVSGASDVFAGAISCSDEAIARTVESTIKLSGESVSPDAAALALRGLRSLSARLKWHGEAGLEVASYLEGRDEIARLIHPALPSHPDHAIWKRDFNGTAGLFALILEPVDEDRVNAFIDALALFGCGFSWGGYESLAIHCDPQIRRTAAPWRAEGPLIRLSVGLEDPADLIADLDQAFTQLR